MNDALALRLLICVLLFAAVFVIVRYGVGPIRRWSGRLEASFDTVLRRQLLLEIEPRTALIGSAVLVVLAFLIGLVLLENLVAAVIFAGIAAALPGLVMKHLERKRREKLDEQLVDGLTTLAASTRAGLNLVQAMELLAQNHIGPIKQEFSQMLREYEMGRDLNDAMRGAAQRIGSPLYRLTFTAIEMHRIRGGNTSESLDRIAESIREIQRLEGKLDALTAQGRSQAMMMAIMPLVFLGILYLIMPEAVGLLFSDPIGRLILLGVLGAIIAGFIWIRRIMDVDI